MALVVTHALPVPSSVPVSVGPPATEKVTVPVGVQVPGATTATCAHRVTAVPQTGEAGDTVRVVVEEAGLTVSGTKGELDAAKSVSPL